MLRHPVQQLSLDVADDVHDVRIALDRERLGHLDAAGAGDPADVVPRQVDQHQVLGALLRVAVELLLERLVLLGRRAARAGAGERPDRHLVAARRGLAPHQDLGRGADDLELVHVVEVHVGRRVERAQGAVEAERRAGVALAQALPDLHLHQVAGGDVFLGAGDGGEEVVLGELAPHRLGSDPLDRRRGDARAQPVDAARRGAFGRARTPRAVPGRRRRSGTAAPRGCRSPRPPRTAPATGRACRADRAAPWPAPNRPGAARCSAPRRSRSSRPARRRSAAGRDASATLKRCWYAATKSSGLPSSVSTTRPSVTTSLRKPVARTSVRAGRPMNE